MYMIITYLGGEAVKAQFGDTTLAFNPISKQSSLKPVRFGADIALVSAQHADFNGIDQVSRGDKTPFIISGPGEYEVGGIFIKGLPSETSYGGSPRINTIFTVALEGMNMCFLGALNTPTLPAATIEALDDIDILFVPIGGEGVLDPAKAYKLAVSLEPKIIIPIHYGENNPKALEQFLKEAGEKPEPLPKLTLKKKDLEGKEVHVMVLTASGSEE
jgi:L-ascorbate metabolism protein UlaG (beta-lactamase superfamily)